MLFATKQLNIGPSVTIKIKKRLDVIRGHGMHHWLLSGSFKIEEQRRAVKDASLVIDGRTDRQIV